MNPTQKDVCLSELNLAKTNSSTKKVKQKIFRTYTLFFGKF